MKKGQGKNIVFSNFFFYWREQNTFASEKDIAEEKVKMYMSEKERVN